MFCKLLGALLCALLFSGDFAHANEEMKQVVTRTYALIDAYTHQLFPHHDAFAQVFDFDHGKAVFSRLKLREGRDKTLTPSPLAQVIKTISNYRAQQSEMDITFVQDILQDAEEVYAAKSFKRVDRQSNLLALQYLLDYLRRFAAPEDFETKKEETQQQSKEKEEKKEKTPPEYPELSKDYKPHTKDTEKEKGKGSKEDQVIIAETNFATPFFGQRYFAEAIRGKELPLSEIPLPMNFPVPARSKNTEAEMIVRTLGRTRVSLFLPPGYKPFQPSDPRARLLREKSGSYVLELDEVLNEVRIPLEKGMHESLQAHVLEVFTRPVGFDINEWPASVQGGIFAQFPPSDKGNLDPTAVAQGVANHLSGEYLYSVGERPETDPVDALKSGAFQCDMAAYTMVSILRDVYEIPSRVVAGYRAKKFRAGKDKKSYLVLPGEAHAWVEVYVNGEWKPFDPTPIKKDKKSKDGEDGEKDEFSDRELENTLKNEEPEEGKKSGEPSEEGNKQSKEERVQQDTDNRLKEVGTNNTTGGDLPEMDSKELAQLLELGSLEMAPKPESNPLLNRAYRVLLRIVLDPNSDGATIQDALNKMSAIYRGLSDPAALGLFLKAIEVHQSSHKALAPWLNEIASLFTSRELPLTYKEIYLAKKSVELYARLLDRNGPVAYPHALLAALEDALSEINVLAHKDSPRISLVDQFHRSLPGLAQQLLGRDYGLTRVGPNQPTENVANGLLNSELNDLRLLSDLTPVSDFILNSIPRPEYEEVRTWARDSAKCSGAELLPLQRFSELARALLLKPGSTVEQNIQAGTAFVPTRRQRVMIPTGFGDDDSERITVVLYDTSGSMAGDLARFQAGLISAFTARAIGDVSPSGRNRHKVVLIPFDDKPGTPVRITNADEAIDIIRNYQSKLKNTNGGTDIQAAMLQALALIADAEQRAGEPLAAANILLMTDGESVVDIDELARARNAIDRDTPLQTMFAAIGGTNRMLIQFAEDSRSAGFERGFYREFNHELIKDALKEADSAVQLKNEGQIFTEKDASALSPNFREKIFKAADLARQFADEVKGSLHFDKAADHLRRFEAVKWLNVAHIDRALHKWLQQVRTFGFNAAFSNKHFLEVVVDDLMKNFVTLTRCEFNGLSNFEQEELRHLMRRAAGLE